MDAIRNSIIVYADILGYSERILQCQNDYFELSKTLDEILKVMHPPCRLIQDYADLWEGNIKFFSDNLLVTIPFRETHPGGKIRDGRAEIARLLDSVAYYQFALTLGNIFIRGCAAIGFAYSDETIVFSPELITLVKCEEKATYPCIRLQPNIVSLILFYWEKEWPGWENIQALCMKDSTGFVFLNYLHPILDHISNSCDGIPDEYKIYPEYKNDLGLLDDLRRHKEIIEDNISKSLKENVLEKFCWLAKYHNYFCQRNFPDEMDLIIPDLYGEFSPLIPDDKIPF